MLNRLVLAAALALAASASTGHAASSVTLPRTSGIELASGGCGPYGHRDYYGYCRPNYPPRPVYRACPWGMHPTPWGCRRNW